MTREEYNNLTIEEKIDICKKIADDHNLNISREEIAEDYGSGYVDLFLDEEDGEATLVACLYDRFCK